jgi:hypothetical protein
MNDMLKLTEAARRLDVPVRDVADMIKRSELDGFTDDDDGRLRVRAADVEKLAITRSASW